MNAQTMPAPTGNTTLVAETIAPLAVAIEQAKGGALVPIEGLSSAQQSTAAAPTWMTVKDKEQAQSMATAMIVQVKASPGDVRMLTRVQALGRDGEREMVQPLALYEKKVTVVLSDNQRGSSANRTLLDVKRHMDLVNPAVLRSKSLPVRWTLGLLTRMPKGDEVLKMIYESQATVKSTVNGLVENLRVDADNLEANMEDLAVVYNGLIRGQQTIERDIYIGDLMIESLKSYVASMPAGPERQNVEGFLADLTNQVIFLRDEENLNLQFFAGAQAVAKLTTAQLHNIRNLGRLMQRSVLANLALNVATAELKTSMKIARDIGEGISNTVRDTAQNLNTMGGDMARMRSEGGLNLEKLEEACSQMEQFFATQAEANTLIIEQGGKAMRSLANMSNRLRSRVDSGHESMSEILPEAKAPAQIAKQ